MIEMVLPVRVLTNRLMVAGLSSGQVRTAAAGAERFANKAEKELSLDGIAVSRDMGQPVESLRFVRFDLLACFFGVRVRFLVVFCF